MNREKLLNTFKILVAKTIIDLYDNVKVVKSTNTQNGFYIDFDMNPVSESDFQKIEKKIKSYTNQNTKIEKNTFTKTEAIQYFKDIHQDYLLSELENLTGKNNEKINLVVFDGFYDLDRGDILFDLKNIKYFKLMSVSGVFLNNDNKNEQIQRLYFVIFATKQEFDDYLLKIEQAQQRDHRRLGVDLDLFVFSDLVGSGLPMFTPRGTVLREELSTFSNNLRLKDGFQKVFIPHLTKKSLYEQSGHWSKFGEELFLVTSQETSDQLILKPMNCPHHTRIYASKPRSYRDLPIKYLETTTVYRDEKTGELGGLNRVRSITQDDSHIFCRSDQIEKEISFLLKSAQDFYRTVGMSLRVRLSYRDDSNAYLGSKQIWNNSQQQLKKAVEKVGLMYFEQAGEAAFYGPKIDFMATDALGREHQVATIQLDFVQPERFDLYYIDENNQKQTPIMIHCALMGSIERFLAVYIEHTNGNFPTWLSPEQLRILSVSQNQEIDNYIKNKLIKLLEKFSIRYYYDNDSESVSKKIRDAEKFKVPYIIVIGQKELESNQLIPRIRQDLRNNDINIKPISLEKFVKNLLSEIQQRSNHTFFD